MRSRLNRCGFWGLFIAFGVLVSLPAFGQALPESVLPSPDTFVPNGGFDAGDEPRIRSRGASPAPSMA